MKKMKQSKCGKWLACVLTMTLLAGVFGGCGKADGEKEALSGTGSDNAPDAARGRYVEREEALPAELTDQTVVQMFTEDDKLHFLTMEQENGKTILREWERQDEGLADATQDWLASLTLSCGDWLELQLVQGKGGRQYLYAGYVAEGEENYKGHLWKGEGAVAEEITPEKWSIPNELWGGYDMIQGLTALDNGTLVAYSYSSIDILAGEDGSVIESEPLTSFYEGKVVTDGENIYLNAGGQIEKRKEGKGSEAVMLPAVVGSDAANGSSGESGVISIGGTGSLALGVFKDGTLIAAGEDGIFRMADTTAESQWEKLAEGVDTEFAMKENWCKDIAVMEDGSFYALFQVGEELKLNRYEFDPNAVSEVTQVLKLYSVSENSMLKQAATMYHKAHPEVLITIENEYPMYYFGVPDYDAVYKKLNTMLMGDNAPDILVLDQLNVNSYGEKGLLVNLEDVVKPMEESGELLSNITGAYVQEDGSRYVVPLQFAFSMALGRDISSENMRFMKSLAEFLSQANDSYMGSQTVAELVDIFYPYFCDEIVREKQLDQEAMGEYLEYLKAIGDNCGIINSRPENENSYGMLDLGAQAKLAFEKSGGFLGCMFPLSMVEYIKGDYAAFENRFYPSMQMGICAKSQYLDTEKDFLQFALSEQLQDMDFYDGFPVNRKSLKKQAAKDRSAYMGSVTIMADDGEYIQFDSKPYPQEVADQLVAICETLNRPVKEDAKIREVLIECLGAYLDGTQSKEETIRKIEAGLKMYLAE